MKLLIVILCITCSLFGQQLKRCQHEIKMDSLTDLSTILHAVFLKKNIILFKPYDLVKFTLHPILNRGATQKVFGSMADDFTFDTYLSVVTFDTRIKIYLSKNTRILTRVLIIGLQTNLYNRNFN